MRYMIALAVVIFAAAASAQETDPGLAYQDFLDAVGAAGESIEASTFYADGDDQSKAEGLRMAVEFAGGRMTSFLGNPDFPYFGIPDPWYRLNALPNPATHYQSAAINNESDYHMRCTRGTSADLIIQTFVPQFPPAAGPSLDPDRLKIEKNGIFDIVLSPEEPSCSPDCNWLDTAGAIIVFVRFTHGDWAKERPGRCHIEKIGTLGEMSPPHTTAELTQKLVLAAATMESQTTQFVRAASTLKSRLPPNTLWVPREDLGEGRVGKYHSQGWFDLAEGQALIVERRPVYLGSHARFSGIDLANFWFQSLEHANRQSSLTTDQAYTWPGEDGIRGTEDDRIRYVISKTDPGVKNWVDTVGRDSGWMTMRWQGADPAVMPPNSQQENPTTQVVNIADLPDLLGADEFISGPEERKAQIRVRQIHMRERYSGWSFEQPSPTFPKKKDKKKK